MMRINRRRKKRASISFVEVLCIIMGLLLVTLLILYLVTNQMDKKEQETLNAQRQETTKPVQTHSDENAFQSDLYSSGHWANNQNETEYPEQILYNEDYLNSFLKDFTLLDTEYLTTDKKFTLSGRWFQTIIDGENCYNTVTQGSMIYFQIRGALSFEIKFIDRTQLEIPYYAYIIDGGEPQRRPISANRVELPDTGEHTITLIMDGMNEREDKWSGEVGFAFSDIVCQDGEMNGYIPKQKRILFLGDSIVEGCMTLGNEAISEYNSATNSMAWYVAKDLFAEPYFIGYGATGIGTVGSFHTASNTLDYLSEKRPLTADDYPKCDLIVINTGTNDYVTEDKAFAQGYDELLQKLHSHYPQVAIVCVIPFTQTHAKEIREATEKYEWAYAVETAGFTFDSFDGIHPSSLGAKKVAGLLVDFIMRNGVL